MNIYTKTILAILGVMLPFSFALAHEGSDSQNDGRATVSSQARIELGDEVRGEIELRGEADPGSHGEKEGLLKRFGTTTPPGFFKEHGSSTEHGTSTKDDNRGKGENRNFISAFFNWIFGLPASTTVADIRAQLQASSTASTTAEHGGVGFWAKVFGFLHLGNSN